MFVWDRILVLCGKEYINYNGQNKSKIRAGLWHLRLCYLPWQVCGRKEEDSLSHSRSLGKNSRWFCFIPNLAWREGRSYRWGTSQVQENRECWCPVPSLLLQVVIPWLPRSIQYEGCWKLCLERAELYLLRPLLCSQSFSFFLAVKFSSCCVL